MALVQDEAKVFGIDPPMDCSQCMVMDLWNQRDIMHKGCTYIIPHCNEFHRSGDQRMTRTACYSCGETDHTTSNHYTLFKRTQMNDTFAPDYQFSSRQNKFKRVNQLPQSGRALRSVNMKKKKRDPNSYAEIGKWVNKFKEWEAVKKPKKIMLMTQGLAVPVPVCSPPPLSHMQPLQATTHPAIPVASTSQQVIEEQEDTDLPQHSPCFTNWGMAIHHFQSNNNRKNKKNAN